MTQKEKSLIDYNEGDNFRGEIITTLYAAKTDYLIFEGDKSGEVTVATDNSELRKLCSLISPQIMVITELLIKKKEKRKFVDMIGLAYSDAIEGETKKAEDICNKLIERIELYKCNIGRFYYLLSCLGIVIIALIISYILEIFRFIPEIIPHFYIMTYASIGGFLSVARNLKKINIDSSVFGWYQFIYGATRILIAMFSGLIMYVLIKSDLILPVLNNSENMYIF